MDRRKSASLGALVLQTSVLALTIRYSRTETVEGPRYLTSTAVVTSELVKLVACLYMVFYTSTRKTWEAIREDLFDVKEAVKTAVPSGLYTLQNNLQFIAVSHLDAATFQVTYQLKILTTAVFSVLFLQRQLDSLRWSALVMLTAGVALVQLGSDGGGGGGGGEGGTGGGSTMVGLMAVLIMCLSSGCAGVYFEKILKASTQSLWAKNVQMAVFSVILGLLGVVTNDWQKVQQHGFFQGYNTLTVIIVLQQAFLGLIISLVMKYADNILKGFASALSIIMTSFISYIFLHDLQPSCSFLNGSIIVMGAVLMYNVDRSAQQHTLETIV
ncbi:hypothetical protein V1264_023586 [Littorina saxatilis]|uniref:Uncharacterized protein n=2 Tax=Littorina saxatilis TaxID=31220 RepID=A0AAN9B8A7_9CAEN